MKTEKIEPNENPALSVGAVSGSVFVVQSKQKLIIHGCFNTRNKAVAYINGSPNMAIIEISVE
jgi:hypothetical protein